MAVQNNANIGFEKQIWDAACVLWGHIPAAEYRKVIVGLIFLRYISSAFEKRYQQLVEEGDGFEDDKDAYAEDNIFFVPEDARWSKIASAAHTPEIGTVIDDAMRAIEKENTTEYAITLTNYDADAMVSEICRSYIVNVHLCFETFLKDVCQQINKCGKNEYKPRIQEESYLACAVRNICGNSISDDMKPLYELCEYYRLILSLPKIEDSRMLLKSSYVCDRMTLRKAPMTGW